MCRKEEAPYCGEAELISNTVLTEEYRIARFRCRGDIGGVRPGMCVMVRLTGTDAPLLGRPFAVFENAGDSPWEFSILYTVVGAGTRALAAACVGTTVFVTGPVGRPFSISAEADIHYVVGGGCGLAAVIPLAKKLSAEGDRTVFVCGSRTAEGQPPQQMCAEWDFDFLAASDDGSAGERGTALDVLLRVMEDDRPQRPAVYASGPLPMLKALAAAAAERGFPCQVSMEERMACGLGVCRGCVIPTTVADAKTGLKTAAVCKDGPVFDADVIDWDALR